MSKDSAILSQQEKIDQLNQQAWDIRVHDSPKAFKLSQKSLALARKIKYKKGIAEATRSMGFCYVRLSKNDEALPLLNESLSLFEELKDLKGQAVVYEYVAVIKRNRGELGPAMELIFKAIALSRQVGFTENEAIHHYQLGVNYKYLGNFDKALDALFKSISIHRKNKNRFYQSYPINVIGLIYFETGDYKKALEYFKEGLKVRQEFRDKLGEAGSLDNIGYTLFKLKRYTQALTYCKKSLAISKATDDKRSQASALQHLAEIHTHAGNIKQAIVSSNASREIRKKTGDKRGEADILLFLANLPQQDRLKVLEWINEALQIAKETKSPDIQSKAHNCLYNYYKQEGKFKEANRQLEKHFTLEKQLQKNSVKQKIANLEITRNAEETRKAAEAIMQKNEELTRLNRELEIETALEKVRTVALAMKEPADMLGVCHTIALQLEKLAVKEIRNVQTAIFYETKGTYMNYEFYAKHDKEIITETSYTNHKVHRDFANQMLKGKGETYSTHIDKKGLKDWIAYQKTTNVFIDTFLKTASSLTYYWHSLGPVALGISTYVPLTKNELNLFKRFLNVFELAYTRYLDIEKAEAQAKEAKIEVALERVRARSLAMHSSNELAEVVGLLYKQFEELDFGLYQVLVSILDKKNDTVEWWSRGFDQTELPKKYLIPLIDHPFPNMQKKQWDSGVDFCAHVLGGKIKKSWEEYLFTKTELKNFPKKIKDQMQSLETVYLSDAFMKFGCLQAAGPTPLPDEKAEILKRFAKVLDQAYTRMTDLQKAEAQAKEARIEAALEKVRSRSLAMHRSEELQEVVTTVFERLKDLDIQTDAINLDVFNENRKDAYLWTAVPGHNYSKAIHIPYNDATIFKDIYNGMIGGKEIHSKVYSRKLKDEFLNYVFEHTDFREIPRERKDMLYAADGSTVSVAYAKNTAIIAQRYRKDPFSDDENEILKRFAKVFEQAYVRFLDLQKAEAQAREAQIEASLERVRSASMAMHSSDELEKVIRILTEQLTVLGFEFHTANFITNASMPDWEIWISSPGSNIPPKLFVPYFDHRLFNERNDAVTSGKDMLTSVMRPEEKSSFLNYFFEYSIAKNTDRDRIKWVLDQPGMALTTVVTKSFSLSVINYYGKLYTEPENEVIKRLAYVFEQSYTRFLDLQKAEAQAREAQIEVALERVRSKAMAMHKSEDLNDAVAVVFEELDKLNLGMLRVGISVLNKEKRCGNVWLTSIDEGKAVQVSGDESFDIHPLLQGAFEAWLRREDFYYVLEGDDLTHYYQAVEAAKFRLPESQMFSSGEEFKRQYCFVAVYNSGGLFAFRENDFPDEAKSVMRRFASVFDLTYKRFLDLQRAEAQSREAHIQLALERVRARSMAMQTSEELKGLIGTVFTELTKLDLVLTRCVIMIYNNEANDSMWWMANSEDPDNPNGFYIKAHDHPPIASYFKGWRKRELKWSYLLEGQVKKEWDAFLFSETELKDLPGFVIEGMKAPNKVYLNASFNNFGNLTLASLDPLSEEQFDILLRFAKVFDLTYTRFNDLQRAEAQAREAQIEASLERVRAKVIAMQNSSELQEISYVFSDQMRQLKIDWQFSYFWLIEEEKDANTFWITWPDNHTSVTEYSLAETDDYTRECLVKWKAGQKMHSNRIPPEGVGHFLETFKQLAHDAGSSAEEVMKQDNFKDGVFYYDAMMKYGSFGLSMNRKATEEESKIQCRFAIEFERAYTRFLDLKQAEQLARQAEADLVQLKIEKQKTEEALTELQATQKQLIQSEKMASLGELTAGIAHEIQNPLNFVNNFSEVSNELLDEMVEEVKKGNYDEVQAIVNDVKQNLEKINHHGKRADGIVKGMLQHSRSSTGQKELIDINTLCDEYLRLSYHGLRAKDKSFNAKFETDLDQGIGKISVVPQEIGRVILNLLNNAFYATSERRKLKEDKYEPTVIISTKKQNDKVEIKVKDNGTGIPQKVLDKIFQPFFTTKPTGQGTGLGLSLSYDIIKAHGGELKVETIEGQGTVFTISLPRDITNSMGKS